MESDINVTRVSKNNVSVDTFLTKSKKMLVTDNDGTTWFVLIMIFAMIVCVVVKKNTCSSCNIDSDLELGDFYVECYLCNEKVAYS